MKIITVFMVFLFMASMPAYSQGHSSYCKNVDSTAASQECLKRHLRAAQNRLNKIYEKISSSLEPERLEALKALQKTWLTYRDAECMWESEKTDSSVLKRIHELSCMARVTENRADLLEVAYSDAADADSQREYGTLSRWMNVVANDYPEAYWRYGGRVEGDLNCDDRPEHVMTGVSLDDDQVEIHVAIVENPPVGKAVPHVFSYPLLSKELGEGEERDGLCSDKIKTKIVDMTNKDSDEQSEEGEEAEPCAQSLEIMAGSCGVKTLNWTGKGFAVAVEKEPENKNETKKK